LPGFTGFDCSRFRCPTGDSYVASSNTAVTRVEVQKVLCQWDASRFPGDDDGLGSDSAEFFTLRLRPTERASLKIAVNATSREIAEAISFLPSVGNVSVAFFDLRNNDSNTEQYRACSSAFNESYGGFLVRFESEAGALPLLDVVQSHVFGRNISISRLQAGSSSNEECSGAARGFCNRRIGRCICNRGYSSSDGAGNRPGNRGDCSYFSGNSEDDEAADDPFRRFYGRDTMNNERTERIVSRHNRAVREMEK
jgi:hypothetical protein